jgi:CubicO group peptidase (beta-lactamase class C family)
MKRYLIIIFLSMILTLNFGQVYHVPWKVTSPEEEGMNSLTFVNGINHFKYDSINIHSLLVIRNNHVVLDACFYPFRKDYVHDMASVTKSITSLLTGIAIDKGYIENEDQLVLKYFPEYYVKNDTLRTLRIRDLLNMASGLKCSWNNGEKELYQMRNSEDWVRFLLNLPFESLPGKEFSYCSGNFYLLAEILQRATKMTCLEFAGRFLFKPMNFGDIYWLNNKKGVNHGWGDLYISTYDMAKIGCLILNKGKWEGNQLISNEWIEKIAPLYKIQKSESYGYGWWLDSENPDEIQAVGRGGQRLFVFKDRNLVIATTGGGYEAGDIDNLVLESIKSYKNSVDNHTLLDSTIKTIQSPEILNNKYVNEDFSSSVEKKEFQFGPNDLKLSTLRFEKRDKDFFIILSFTDGSKEEHPIGMNDNYKISKERELGLPIALKGYWERNKLIINYNELCRINLYKFTFTFSENTVVFDFQDRTNHINLILKGSIKEI